jgi:23S rRNA (adenine2030-N6)-methyltransferase
VLDDGPYRAALDALNPDGELRLYPGSPLVAQRALRGDDRLILVEAAEAPAAALRRRFAGDPRIAVHRRDGWEALKALLPPGPKRGLVLIDPPFEAAGEFDRLAAAMAAAARRWPSGIVAGWYPLKDSIQVARLQHGLVAAEVAKVLRLELTFRAGGQGPGLAGSGLVVINPPWRFDIAAAERLARLAQALGLAPGAARVDWLVPERDPAQEA